jgi:DNA-binding NarL/FixJ family response regulator
MSKLRILVVEDHAMVREGLKGLIEAQPDMEVVGEASNGRAAVQYAAELLPQIVLMDISMPDMNGLQATKQIKKKCPSVKVLTLTRHTDKGYLQELLRAGASGYVLKQSESSELMRSIRAVGAGNKYLDPAVTENLLGDYSKRLARDGGEGKSELTDRESEVLRLIAWGHSNKEIAGRLGLSVKTVEVHKANAMNKLNMRSRIDIVRFALFQGWLNEA